MVNYKVIYCRNCSHYSGGTAARPKCRYCNKQKVVVISRNLTPKEMTAEIQARNGARP